MQRPASLSLNPRRSRRAVPRRRCTCTPPPAAGSAARPAGSAGCHFNTAYRPLLCPGWLLTGADGNDTVPEMIRTGVLPRPELPDRIQLYDSYAEMAIANSVDPILPTLYERPAAQPADLVSLQEYLAHHDYDHANGGTYDDG
ncbi:DUF6283 family protein [Streptomyces achromogenes]|uniref:DUF6283 family protein n=1 Tax=Streptomyces achromogenes TaxID=67255 RepID=UPI00371FF901